MGHSATFAADGTKKVTNVKRVNGTKYAASIYIAGGFGGGTLTLHASIDNGATLIPIKDSAGAAISVTVNDLFFIELGGGQDEDEQIYATLSGSTAPSLTVTANSNA